MPSTVVEKRPAYPSPYSGSRIYVGLFEAYARPVDRPTSGVDGVLAGQCDDCDCECAPQCPDCDCN